MAQDFLPVSREDMTKRGISQLKVAPEHISDEVLKHMGKPPVAVYRRFQKRYKKMMNHWIKNSIWFLI